MLACAPRSCRQCAKLSGHAGMRVPQRRSLPLKLAQDRQPMQVARAPLLYAFALLSGACALVYEVAWTKMLALTFGRTTLAASSVVGGFMVTDRMLEMFKKK